METLLFFYVKVVGAFLLRFFFNLEVRGRENLRDVGRGPCIIAPNHRSFFDPPVLGIAFPKKLYYFAKAELFDIPVLSYIVATLGSLPIERDAYSSMTLRKGLRLLKQGKWLVIFPEGTRSRAGTFLPPEKGIGFLHCKTGAPIIPVFIQGTDRAFPVGASMVKPVKIRVIIGKKMTVCSENYAEVAAEVMKAIQRLGDGRA